MKKRIAAIVLCVFCLLAIAGCSQSKPDAETAQPTAAQETMPPTRAPEVVTSPAL